MLRSAQDVPITNTKTKAILIFWRRKWQLSPVFLPGKFHGQRSLVGFSP